MDNLCIRCKGKGLCGGPCKILSRFLDSFPKPKLHFSGTSSPEIFVGRVGYPFVNSGIFASDRENAPNFPTAEEWSKNNFSMENILRLRSQLIYSRSKTNIKLNSPLKKITQEISLSSKPLSAEFFLKKKPRIEMNIDSVFRPVMNSAPARKIVLEENPKVPLKVDKIVSDCDVKSTDAVRELYPFADLEYIQRLLSAGLLGKKSARKMVPTRWSITATDDTISKQLLEKIKDYPEINEIKIFRGNFVGNYINILLLPERFSFEAMEIWFEGEDFSDGQTSLTQDYEGFLGRKNYAFNVTGGYYAMRLPATEYLEKIKRQASVLVIREIFPEYYAPLGVGIVRETARRAFANPPENFDDLNKALEFLKQKIKTPIEKIKRKSFVLNNYSKQKSLRDFLN